jgi:hypothetical protein
MDMIAMFSHYVGLPYDFELDKEITELAATQSPLQDFGRLNVWLDAESVITHFSIE